MDEGGNVQVDRVRREVLRELLEKEMKKQEGKFVSMLRRQWLPC